MFAVGWEGVEVASLSLFVMSGFEARNCSVVAASFGLNILAMNGFSFFRYTFLKLTLPGPHQAGL